MGVDFPDIVKHVKPRYENGNVYAGKFEFKDSLIKPPKEFSFKLNKAIADLQLSSNEYKVESMLIDDAEIAYLHLNQYEYV